MVRARADEASAGAEDTVTGIEKERDSDDGGNACFPAEAATAAEASFVDPAAPTAADDDCSNAGTVERSVAVSGRRSCHANDGVRSIRDERTPERVRTEKVGGSDEKAAVDGSGADDDDDDEKENAEPFAALWRGVDDRV